MRDDYLDRPWADNHHQLSTAVHKAIHKLVRSFRVSMAHLNRQQFDAPAGHGRERVRPMRRNRLRRPHELRFRLNLCAGQRLL